MKIQYAKQLLVGICLVFVLFVFNACTEDKESALEVRDYITEAEAKAILSLAVSDRNTWCQGTVTDVKLNTCTEKGDCDHLMGTKPGWQCDDGVCPYSAGEWITVKAKCGGSGTTFRSGCRVKVTTMEACK